MRCPECGEEMEIRVNYSYRPIKSFYVCECGYSEEMSED